MLMLAIIAMESSDRFSGAHTLGMLRALLALFSIHPSAHALTLLNVVLRKCGHVLGYGLLSFLFFRACRGTFRALSGDYDWRTSRLRRPEAHAFHILWQWSWALLAMAVTALTAAADELHQMTIPSRGGSWWDVLLDSVAGLLAQILILLFAVRNARRAQARMTSSPMTHAGG
jgi:VanZ family protein